MSDKKIIVFHGKSDLTAKKKINHIVNKHIPTEERNIAVTHFRSYEIGKGNQKNQEVMDALFSLPLGCTMQLVVIWQYHNLFSFLQLCKIIPLIPSNTWAVFISDASLPEREKKKISALPVVEIIVEYFAKWNEIRHHLQRFFQEHQLKAKKEVIDYLVKVFSDSPFLMNKELEKVADYFTSGKQVTLLSLEGILAVDKNEQVAYTVVNKFFEKQTTATLKKFKHYIGRQGDLPLLIAIMIRELILIVKFKEMKSEQIPLEKIFRDLGVIYDKHKKSLQAKDVLFTYLETVRILEECLLIDKNLKQVSFVSLGVDKQRVPLKAKLHFERLLTVVV